MSRNVLERGIKDMNPNDCKDILRSEEWYAERGIAFRPGYLEGCCPLTSTHLSQWKTSLVHSLAGELSLNIYVVSLSFQGMSDKASAHSWETPPIDSSSFSRISMLHSLVAFLVMPTGPVHRRRPRTPAPALTTLPRRRAMLTPQSQ